jgi:RecA/RadA recombinase
MVRIQTEMFDTTCATNHLIETLHNEKLSWKLAEDIVVGDIISTENGPEPVTIASPVGDAECYDFEIDHPNQRYWGDGISSHNSGKSYIATANVIKDCQRKNVWPVLIDTENALDKSWLKALDVDTEFMEKISGATVDDVARLIGEVIDEYKTANASIPYEDRPKMLFIIDSLGMLITPNNEKQFMEGDMKGDMGIKAKQITAMIRVCMAKIASQPIGLIATNHVMDSQDQYTPDKIPGGKMLEFASSVIVQMNKFLLKEDEDGNKLTDGAVAGIRSTAVVRKSRYSKPFEKIKISIPYVEGMDPYSGCFDLFVKKGLLEKDGARWTYTSRVTGEVFKNWRKDLKKNGVLAMIIAEHSHWEDDGAVGFGETDEPDDE